LCRCARHRAVEWAGSPSALENPGRRFNEPIAEELLYLRWLFARNSPAWQIIRRDVGSTGGYNQSYRWPAVSNCSRKFGPSIEPGIWMSVNTARMSFLLSRIRIAPSASTASMASKPAFSAISIAVARVARLQPREQLVCGPQRLPVAAIHFSCGPHRLTRCAQKRSRSPGF
jgi:hypothetical protein